MNFPQKHPRAHTNKIGTPPPPKHKIPPPPKTRNFMDMGFSCRKSAFFPGVHKIDAPISGPRIVECPQMWVWPQVPLGGSPPSTPLRPRTPPPHQPGPAPSRSLAKRAKGGVGGRAKERAGRGGFGLREGSSNYNGGWGGNLQTPVGARPTSGGFQELRTRILRTRGIRFSDFQSQRIILNFFNLIGPLGDVGASCL